MPVCVLCEGETFDCTDGLYYCQTCGTQSQDIRDEEVGDADEVDGRLQVKKQGKRGAKKQFFADKGKPWFMYEAYQHIIKVQVEYLIKLGVNPALKDVVFKLWYKYLQVTGNAFTGSHDNTVPTKGSIFYYRHADLLGVNKRKQSGRKKRVDPSSDDHDGDNDDLELCSHFSDEEFYEDDDPSKVLPKDDNNDDDTNLGDDWTVFSGKNRNRQVEDVPTSEDSSDSSEDEFVGSVTFNRSKRRKIQSGHVTLQSTLAFCFLGLLWIDEPVFASDLVRWAKQGQLPYFQATRHIPRHMKFGCGDFSCLCPLGVPLVSKILKLATQISRVLQLPCFPEPKWSTYTARFITDLHLPGFLHGVVHKLTEMVKVKTRIHPAIDGQRHCSIPNLEAGAVAFIVVALKLCYGIDDRTEKEQEAIAIARESSSKSRGTIPLFTDWLKSWKHCEAKKFENGVPWTDEQFKLVRNPTAYTAFCKSDIFGSWEPTDQVYTGSQQKNSRANRITNEESQEKYTQLFKSLMSREQEEEFESSATPKVTSFPATCAHVTDSGTANCFDRTRSRGIKTERLFGEDPLSPDNDLKYISYSANCTDQNSFHGSYQTLLTILADRIEMKPMDIQSKVTKLENALFFGQALRDGVL